MGSGGSKKEQDAETTIGPPGAQKEGAFGHQIMKGPSGPNRTDPSGTTPVTSRSQVATNLRGPSGPNRTGLSGPKSSPKKGMTTPSGANVKNQGSRHGRLMEFRAPPPRG